jgi:hypothetical protein
MSVHQGNIGTFLRTMTRGPVDQRRSKPFVGIDECLNRREIDELTTRLLRRDHIDSSGPLWFQTRARDGVPTGTFMGGVDRDSAFRGPNSLVSDIGVPLKHDSWSDFRVVHSLVANFTSYDQLVLLSENIRNDVDGLRSILNKVVAPALLGRDDGPRLTAIFKKGKTHIDDYARAVETFVEQGAFETGYNEVLF